MQFFVYDGKGYKLGSFPSSAAKSSIQFQYTGNAIIYDLQMPFNAACFANNLLFILFNLGQMFHSKLIGLTDTIYQTEWHRYPRNVRRFVQLVIMRSQRPFYLSAFGIIELNLENYIAVSTKCE